MEVEDKLLALSEIVCKLENLFDLLNRLYFEDKLPRPVITVQSTPRAYGHCTTKKIWNAGEENDLTETCQNGRYHNKLFKQEAEARGLIIDYDRANGYSTTTPSESFIEALRENGYALEVPFARHTLGKKSKKASRIKAHAYTCPCCGQTVRTTGELSLICGICEVAMERTD